MQNVKPFKKVVVSCFYDIDLLILNFMNIINYSFNGSSSSNRGKLIPAFIENRILYNENSLG